MVFAKKLRDRVVTAAALTFVIGAAHAAPGDLDLRFGEDGVAFVGRGGQQEAINSLLPEADGAVLAAGAINVPGAGAASGNDMTVLRLLGNGDLDPAFANGGVLQVGLGGDSEYITAMARQADGRIVAVGALEALANTDFGVIRFHADGTLDTSFGDADAQQPGLRRGRTHFNMGPTTASNDEARAVAVQSDGRIVVAGVGYAVDGNFTYPRFALARLTADGEIDASFGDNGRVIAPATQFQIGEFITAIALRRNGQLAADDSITVVGYVFARNAAVIRRYTADGAPDQGFGTNGVVILSDAAANGTRTGLSQIDDAVLLEDGRMVLVGRGGDRGFAFLGLNANGTLDTTFGTNGRSHVKFSGASDYDEPSALRMQADGKLVAAGYATAPVAGGGASADFASVRLLPNGQPDTGYGDGSGRSSYPLSNGEDVALTLAVMGDGSLLFAGRADIIEGPGGDNDGAFLRLQGDPGIFKDGFEDR